MGSLLFEFNTRAEGHSEMITVLLLSFVLPYYDNCKRNAEVKLLSLWLVVQLVTVLSLWTREVVLTGYSLLKLNNSFY